MKKFRYLVLVLSAILLPFLSIADNGADSTSAPVDTKLVLNYLCLSNDSVTLTAGLTIRRGETIYNLDQADVVFFSSDGVNNTEMGKSCTNQEGIATITININRIVPDKDGVINYGVRFAGNDKYNNSEALLAAKPARVKLFFSIEDSIKTLKVTAMSKDLKGADIPLAGETVKIYVPRLFSLLKIGEITLDEAGIGTMEFPKEIVGDTLGNLVVLARIEEHDQFGYVQGKNTINWGVPKQYYKAEVPSRELWTPIAPMWMIITLIIMLLGVWAHYVYAVYELVMIKKLSKKPQPGSLS
jgi:hypothetical protein